MTDKSINPTDGLGTSNNVVDFVLTGGMYGSIFGPSTTDPRLNANNGYDSGVNPQESLETASCSYCPYDRQGCETCDSTYRG